MHTTTTRYQAHLFCQRRPKFLNDLHRSVHLAQELAVGIGILSIGQDRLSGDALGGDIHSSDHADKISISELAIGAFGAFDNAAEQTRKWMQDQVDTLGLLLRRTASKLFGS